MPPRNHDQQHDADGEVEVLGAHFEAEGQAETEHADHQGSKRCPDDGAFATGGKSAT